MRYCLRSVDRKFVELLRVPTLILDWINMQVLVSGIDQVHEITEASGHIVRGETKSGTTGQSGLARIDCGRSTNCCNLSCIEQECSRFVTAEDKHFRGVTELDSCCRHRFDEIRIVDFKLLPFLHGNDGTVGSRILVASELVGWTSIEVINQTQIANFALVIRAWHEIDEPLIHHHRCRIDDLSRELGYREPMIGLSVVSLTLFGYVEATCLTS